MFFAGHERKVRCIMTARSAAEGKTHRHAVQETMPRAHVLMLMHATILFQHRLLHDRGGRYSHFLRPAGLACTMHWVHWQETADRAAVQETPRGASVAHKSVTAPGDQLVQPFGEFAAEAHQVAVLVHPLHDLLRSRCPCASMCFHVLPCASMCFASLCFHVLRFAVLPCASASM